LAGSDNLFDGTSGSSKGSKTTKVTPSTNLFGPSKPKVTKPVTPAASTPVAPKTGFDINSFMKQQTPTGILKNANEVFPKVQKTANDIANSPVGKVTGTVMAPIVSAGSFVLNALQSGNAAIAGSDYQRELDFQKGLITHNDIVTAAINGEKINGKKVTSKVVNGQVVWNLKPTVTDPTEVSKIEQRRVGAAAKNATAFLRPNEKTMYGADIAKLKNPDIAPIEELGQGLAYDLTHDPLIAVNPVKWVKAAKPAMTAASTFLKELSAAKAGNISVDVLKGALKGAEISSGASLETAVKAAEQTPSVRLPKGTTIPTNLKGRAGKAAEVQTAAEQKIADSQIKTVKLTPEDIAAYKDSTGLTNPVLLSALDAAGKAYKQVATAQKATKFLEKFVKNEVSGVFVKTPTAMIHPDFKTGGFKVMGGNGEEIAKVTTRKEAQAVVDGIKKGTIPQGEIMPIPELPKPVEAAQAPVMTTKEAIKLAAENGSQVELRKNVVHEATDGNSYVFDGSNLRKFASVGDATAYVKNTTAGLVEEAKVLKDNNKWVVRQGDSITVHKTKAEATAAADKINTGQITPARITTGAAPIAEATKPTVSVADIAKIKPTSAEGKAAQKVLKDVQKASSEISGTQVGIKAVDRTALRDIIKSKNLAIKLRVFATDTAKKAVESIRLASRLDGYNPVALRESLMYGNNEAKGALLRIIDATPVMTEAGEKTTIGSLLSGKSWNVKLYPQGTMNNLLKALEGIATEIASAGKASVSTAKFEQIKTMFGADIAEKIKATGILDAKPTQEAMDKYLALEKNLEAASKTVKYTSFEDVIAGLASGDSISAPDLAKVIGALDPAKKIIKQVEDAVEKQDTEFLKSIVSGFGVQTINDVQKKILFTADFSNMLKVEGIGYDDVLSSVFSDSADAFHGPALTANGDSVLTPEFIRLAEMAESPEAFATILKNNVDSAGDIATEAMNTAFQKLGANLDEIKAAQGSYETVSLYGDITNRVSKKAWVGRAALPEQVNQVFDAYVASTITGIARDRFGKAKKALGSIEDYLFEETINEFEKISAALGLLGIRIQRNKIVTALTKKTGEPKHLVYLHSGDIFKAFDAVEGGRQVIKDAFFSGGKNYKRDSFLHQNLGEGARYVLEQDAAGAAIDMEKLAKLVQDGVATPSVAPTEAFLAKMPKLAERLAAQLADPVTIEAMKNAHLTKSIGLANRVINKSHSVAQDIFATLWDAIRLNALNGDLSVAETVKLMRSHLNKLATAGDFFNAGSGPLASAAFRSWSQILTLRGKIADVDILDKQEWANFRTMLNNFSAGDKALAATEQKVLVPKHTLLSKKQQAAFLKKENLQIEKAQDEIIRGRREDIAAQLSDEIDAGHFDNTGIPEQDVPALMLEALHDRGIQAETQFVVEHMNPAVEPAVMQLRTTTEKWGSGRFKKITLSDLYGFKGREEIKPLQIQLETQTFRAASQFARYMDDLRIRHSGLSQEQFDEAITLIRDHVDITDEIIKNTDPAILQFAQELKPATDLLFGTKGGNGNGFIDAGISGAAFKKALQTVNMSVRSGIPAGIENYAAEDMWRLLSELPFGTRPASILEDTGEILKWEERKADFAAAKLDPLLAISNIMQAAAAAKFQTGLGRGFAARFSHLAEGISPAEAINKGYVKMIAGDGGSNLMLDSVPEDMLFPPHLAEQFGQAMRDWDYQFTAPSNVVIRTVMQLTGMVKALQTIVNPAHHINNFTGTSTMMMMRGVTNPAHYGIGMRLARKHFAEKVATDWHTKQGIIKDAEITSKKMEQLLRASGFEGRTLEQPTKGLDFGQFVSVIEKGKRVSYTDEDIMKVFEDSGLFEESIYTQDITGLEDNLFTDTRSLGEADVAGKIKGRAALARARQIERNITRAPGDIAAAHGNALRITHAMHILQSRSWKNLQEGIDAAVKELAVWQPTAKSLSPFERKYGRLATSYYTWMRMAQVATMHLFLENNRSINIAQDLLYNLNTLNGYNPQNTGTAYPSNNLAPSFLTSKVGQVLFTGSALPTPEPIVADPQLIYAQAINFWGMQVDLSKPFAENIIGVSNGRPVGIFPQLAAVPAKNMMLAASPIYKAIFQRNPVTGQGLNISTPMDWFNEFVAPELGGPGQAAGAFGNLLTGTDANKSTLSLIKKLSGMGLMEPASPNMQKTTKLENSARFNEWLKNTGQK